jgi:HlyD family secretion protein
MPKLYSMDMPTSSQQIQSTSEVPEAGRKKNGRPATRIASIVVGIIAAVVVALSLFYCRLNRSTQHRR